MENQLGAAQKDFIKIKLTAIENKTNALTNDVKQIKAEQKKLSRIEGMLETVLREISGLRQKVDSLR